MERECTSQHTYIKIPFVRLAEELPCKMRYWRRDTRDRSDWKMRKKLLDDIKERISY
jgi:hypothetical protein